MASYISLFKQNIAVVALVFIISFTVLLSPHTGIPIPQRGIRVFAPANDDALLRDVMNETLGFGKIFVISLPSRTDRRIAMSLAAGFTNLTIEFVNAVDHVNLRTLPPNDIDLKTMTPAHLGAWSSHLNAAKRIVEGNLASALILEDDGDWDIRIKSQLVEFAKASRLLVQPVSGTKDVFLDPTYHGHIENASPSTFVVGEHSITPPTSSPYGDIDRWDMLWLGHCGATLPTGDEDPAIPLARAVILNETTVPEHQHINTEFGSDTFKEDYPFHTRVVFRSAGNVCTLGYALSQAGARRMLYELGIHKLDGAVDKMLSWMCSGTDDRARATCITSVPQYFQHHRPAGNWSFMTDISGVGSLGSDNNPVAFTTNIRKSVRVNFPKLISGDTNYTDMYRDGEPATGL